jgi:hypothetical protein
VNEKKTIREASNQRENCDSSPGSIRTEPSKSVRSASAELDISQATVHKIVKVKLHEHAYKIQDFQMS